ncbi:uncharacterized protein LOC134944515 isoform X2 [Pseudophryne corroboree]|uniref:uncharacterized protein LOC134944515 isoform X2 n=1 Tax=Pseudophryne corroboree TaxID=495146 RepID=UPI003081D7AB
MQSVSPTEARNMGHIAESDFPQQAGHYSVINLRMLAAALGFPNDVIESSFPPGSLDRGGISSQGLRRLLDQGCLTSDLHFTYNMKSGLYNVNLIIKCLDLLDSYTISFTGIQEARVAFSAYEHLDQKGVRTETNILLKIVKMSGCGVSPQKLSLYLKQRSPSYVEAGRVQLYEFLDLLAICEPRKKFFIQEGRLASTDKARGLYQMDDVRSSVLTPDEKLTRHLNWRFQHVDSWMLPQATTAAAKPCSFRICQQTETLNETRPQPPRSKNEASFVQPEDSWTLVTPVPHLKCRCYTPKRGDPILTEQEIQKTQNDIEDLTYQMETLLGHNLHRLLKRNAVKMMFLRVCLLQEEGCPLLAMPLAATPMSWGSLTRPSEKDQNVPPPTFPVEQDPHCFVSRQEHLLPMLESLVYLHTQCLEGDRAENSAHIKSEP